MKIQFFFKKKNSKKFEILKSFEDEDLKKLSRIAVSPNGDQIAIVSEISSGKIVQKHIEPFNNQKLDEFSNTFTEDVLVRNFMSDTLNVNQAQLKKGYNNYFKNNPSTTVKVINRIILKDKVVDEELVTIGNKTHNQATIYTTRDGKIATMTFIAPAELSQDAAAVVDAQIKTYNDKDIEGFMSLFSETTTFNNYPTGSTYKNVGDAKIGYSNLFKKYPDLKATVKNRISIGNYIIDHEELTTGKNKWYGVVISKVIDGKITEVVFL